MILQEKKATGTISFILNEMKDTLIAENYMKQVTEFITD